MSDGQDNENRPGRAPLTLKRPAGAVSSGTVKQSFSHGRSKTVVVETKRRRETVNLAAPSTAERRPEPARPAPAAASQRAAPAPAGGLSQEEMQRRQRVAADFARQQQERAEQDARSREEEAARSRQAEAPAAKAPAPEAPAAEAPKPAPAPVAAPEPVAAAPEPAPAPAPAPVAAAPKPAPAPAAAPAPAPQPAAAAVPASRSFEQRREDQRRDDRQSTTTYRAPPGGAPRQGERPEFRNERAPREAGFAARPPREGGFRDGPRRDGDRPPPRAGETVRYSANAPRPAPRGDSPRPGGPRTPNLRAAAAPAAPEVQRAARAAPPGAGKDRRPGDFDDDRRGRGGGGGGGGGDANKPTSRVKGAPQRREGRLTIQAVAGDEDSAERMRSLASVRRAREREKEKRKGGGADETGGAKRDVIIPDAITVQDLSQRMTTRGVEVIKFMMRQGMMLKINDVLDADTAELIATEFGHTVTRVSESDVETGFITADDADEHLEPRAPVVAVMGHVDHGKTSLLDALRASDVAGGEHGGITQHIGAYQVKLEGGQSVTFLDTPGHAAFSAMRARGANVTDIVILVVAADDGVMPQTIEAINHAKAAGAPLIVAINKIDKPDADPQKVINELLQHEIVVESLGGDTQVVEVSAKTRQGLDNLIEAVLLQAEVMDLKANPDRTAEGVVIESKLDKGRGAVATVLVKRGTLKRGDIVVAGSAWGRVRALINERDEQLPSAGPSEPVEILGLDGTPDPGDVLAVVEDEARARELTEYRVRQRREKTRGPVGAGTSMADMMAKLQDKRLSELPLIIKADVQGSVEAIIGSLDKMATDEVRARIILSGAGGINESDVMLAKGSGAPVIGFNVRASRQARDLAEREGVEIRYYAIIYDLLDDIKGVLSGMLAPIQRETFLGNAEVLQIFEISKVGKIAGCKVTEGVVRKGARVRIVREDVVVLELGTLQTLKRFKDEVNEVNAGQECGMNFGFQDIRAGDLIECFTVEEIQRTLA